MALGKKIVGRLLAAHTLVADPAWKGRDELAIDGIRAAEADRVCRDLDAASRGAILDRRRPKARKQAARNTGTRSHASAGAA